MSLREDLLKWARYSRESKLSDIHQKRMMNHALQIDELLREMGSEWINDYETNRVVKKNIHRR